jgi:hypothetical protein
VPIQFLDDSGATLAAGVAVTITPGPITGTTDGTGSIAGTLRSDTLYTATFAGEGAPTQSPSFYGNTTGAHALDDNGNVLTDDNADELQFDVAAGTIVPIAGYLPDYTILVTPANARLTLGVPQQYAAGLYLNGAFVRDVTTDAHWYTDGNLGALDGFVVGLFTPSAPGFGTLSASYNTESGAPVTGG